MFLGIHDCKIWGETKNKVSEQCRIELAFFINYDDDKEWFNLKATRSKSMRLINYKTNVNTEYGENIEEKTFYIDKNDLIQKNRISKSGYTWDMSLDRICKYEGLNGTYTYLEETTPNGEKYDYDVLVDNNKEFMDLAVQNGKEITVK